MIASIARSSFISICIAVAATFALHYIRSNYIFLFLANNIVIIQIGLLAINAATLGIVLIKLKDIVDKGVPLAEFSNVRVQMLLSIREQIALIVIAICIVSLAEAKALPLYVPQLLFQTLLLACFVYSLLILYDTAKSVFVVIDGVS